MRKIDVNAMIGMYVKQDLAIQGAQSFLEAMAFHQIEKAVVYHADARFYNPIQGNEKLLRLAKQHDCLIPCFILSPHYKYSGGWEALEQQLQREDIRFAKLYPSLHGYSLNDAHTDAMFEIALRQNMTMLLSAGELTDAAGGAESFVRLCRDYPNVNIVLVEALYRRNMSLYGYLEQFENMHIEFSTLNNWLAYEEAVRLFGSKRLLFGSNMPFNSPGPAITMLSYSDLSHEDRDNIACLNAERLISGGGDRSAVQ
ncbi:amidohydrolase family protein [Cohnella soli]|uniref:Amidohydrolase family protein n=1 Tax=Cohnella soli TaxID=425005 RepID=A0ABW0I492_9BACL